MIKINNPQELPRVNPLGNDDIENARIAQSEKTDSPDPSLFEVHAKHVGQIENFLQMWSRGQGPDLLEVKVAIEGCCCFGGLSGKAGKKIAWFLASLPDKHVKGQPRRQLLDILHSYNDALRLALPGGWRHPTSRGVRTVLKAVITKIEAEGPKRVQFDGNIRAVSRFNDIVGAERFPNPPIRSRIDEDQAGTAGPVANGDLLQIHSSLFRRDVATGKLKQTQPPEQNIGDLEVPANDSQANMLNAQR